MGLTIDCMGHRKELSDSYFKTYLSNSLYLRYVEIYIDLFAVAELCKED